MMFYRVFIIPILKIVNKVITCLLNNTNFNDVNFFYVFGYIFFVF